MLEAVGDALASKSAMAEVGGNVAEGRTSIDFCPTLVSSPVNMDTSKYDGMEETGGSVEVARHSNNGSTFRVANQQSRAKLGPAHQALQAPPAPAQPEPPMLQKNVAWTQDVPCTELGPGLKRCRECAPAVKGHGGAVGIVAFRSAWNCLLLVEHLHFYDFISFDITKSIQLQMTN